MNTYIVRMYPLPVCTTPTRIIGEELCYWYLTVTVFTGIDLILKRAQGLQTENDWENSRVFQKKKKARDKTSNIVPDETALKQTKNTCTSTQFLVICFAWNADNNDIYFF